MCLRAKRKGLQRSLPWCSSSVQSTTSTLSSCPTYSPPRFCEIKRKQIYLSKLIIHQEKDTTKSSYYGICSLTYLAAMVTSNKALAWVNYPTQVIGSRAGPSNNNNNHFQLYQIIQANPVNPFPS